MIKVSVVIPYFQRKSGILRLTLQSVLQQRLSPGIRVDVIVVDDGSPSPVEAETEGLAFVDPFYLTVIKQPNGGVAVARNTGLRLVTDSRYVAFLDSDDIWHETHLSQGVTALERGYDLYFCDNKREGHHDSHFASSTKLILPYITDTSPDALIELPKDTLVGLILREFPAQASTVIFRHECAPELLFVTALKNAGEDMIFFVQLAGMMRKVCFSPHIMVDCGSGVNLYFGNIGWDSPGHMQREVDRLRAHMFMQKRLPLSPADAAWNKAFMSGLRRNLVFHVVRKFIKSKGHWPNELRPLIKEDKSFFCWFVFYAFQVAAYKPLGLFRPT
jgi:succinoglycan biosynthesis protein ExoW